MYYKDYIRQMCIVFDIQHVQFPLCTFKCFFYFNYLCIKFSFMTLVLYLVDLKNKDQQLYYIHLNQKNCTIIL